MESHQNQKHSRVRVWGSIFFVPYILVDFFRLTILNKILVISDRKALAWFYSKGLLAITFHSTARVDLIDVFDNGIHRISWHAKFGDHPERTIRDMAYKIEILQNNTTSFPNSLLQQSIKFLRFYTPGTRLGCYILNFPGYTKRENFGKGQRSCLWASFLSPSGIPSYLLFISWGR